jgi:hypothetical protein
MMKTLKTCVQAGSGALRRLDGIWVPYRYSPRTSSFGSENIDFAIEAVARLFAFPDRDLAQSAFVFADDLQSYFRQM